MRCRRLAKRYGCFRLPHVRGASVVKAKRKDVSWLARTDPQAKQIEFSDHFGKLTPDGQRYIVAHEEAHLRTGPDHNAAFYAELKRLVTARRIPWPVAYELESWNCHAAH
jgi:Protein of unknown function DUF45